ncbi:MAG: hypothetical protein ACSLE6_09930 [Mycobacterium sp.]
MTFPDGALPDIDTILFPVKTPDVDGATGIAGRYGLDQAFAEAALKQRYVQDNPKVQGPLDNFFSVNNIRKGPIPRGIIEVVANRLFGTLTEFPTTQDAIMAIGEVPVIGDLAEIFTGEEDGNLNDIGTWVNNVNDDFQDLLDKIFDGAGGTIGSIGASLASVFSALQGHRAATDTAQSNVSTAATNIQGTWDKIVEAAGGLASGSVLSNVYDAIFGINTGVLSAQVALQQQNNGNHLPVGGNSSNYTPATVADGTALSGWTSSGTDSICIRNNHIGIKSGVSAGRHYAVYTAKLFATDGQSCSGTFCDTGGSAEMTTLHLRSTSTLSDGAYALFETDRVVIGYYTMTGGTFTFNSLFSTSTTVPNSARVEFRCFGLDYYAFVNGVLVLSGNDVGNNVNRSTTTNVSTGITMYRNVVVFTYDSFRLASFSMSDYVQGPLTMVGWQLNRSSTSNAALAVANGAVAALPSSFFSATDFTNGATITTQGTGLVTVNQAGIWELNASIIAVTNGAGPYMAWWVLYKNGAQYGAPVPPGVPSRYELSVGDTVQPRLIAVGDTPTHITTGELGAAFTIDNVRGPAVFFGELVKPAV